MKLINNTIPPSPIFYENLECFEVFKFAGNDGINVKINNKIYVAFDSWDNSWVEYELDPSFPRKVYRQKATLIVDK